MTTRLNAQAASTATADGATTRNNDDEKPVVLSPFTVSTDKDSGYKATNSTSGTRLSTPIKDVPMDLEVITSQFIQDTGSSNLRDALRFSGGIILNSQVDGLVNPGTYDNLSNAGSNDPRGVTRDPNQTTYKIRGLINDSILRDGFSRQAFTDTINVDRIEVVRGPSALLYGIGDFGGVVNYIPKMPELKAKSVFNLEVGNEGYQRADIDLTGPLTKSGSLLYRLTGALQQNGDFTDLYKNQERFLNPVFTFRPWENTQITLDNEWGTDHVSGDGFQSIRMVDVSNGSEANSRRADFLGGGLINLRTFKWSGPDTFHDTGIQNHLLDVDQKLAENLFLKVGAQRTHETTGSQQVTNAHINGTSPPFDRSNPADYWNGHFLGDILYRHFVYNQIGVDPTDTTAQYYLPPTDTAVLQYQWSNVDTEETRDQVRAELSYKFEGFGTHSFLFGVNYQKATKDELDRSNPRSSNTRGALARDQIYNYKAIDDFGYFSYDQQGYGGPSLPVVPLDGSHNINWDLGYYAVYHGSFFKDRINLIGGVRRDRTDAASSTIAYDSGPNPTWTVAPKAVSAPTKNSPQFGLTVKLIPAVSAYAVHSTGVVPNYYLTDGAGSPLAPTQSKSDEVGLKFDLLNGRISGTIAAYKIKRSGTPRFIWWAPNAVKMAQSYKPDQPLVYAIDGITPGFYDYIKNKPYMAVLDPNHVLAPGGNFTFKVTGANSPGAQVMDDAQTFQEQSYKNWPGWSFENGYEQALTDGSGNALLNSPGSNSADGAWVPIDDENKGWDAQFVISPTDDWQIVATYAHNQNKMTSAYNYVKVPYVFGSQWAIWNFPTFGWGTFVGLPASQAYTDPTDSSTYKGIGVGTGQSLDGSPLHIVTVWNRYDFRHVEALRGLVGGLGVQWQSPEKWTNGYATDGTWIAVPGPDGQLHSLILETRSRLTVSAMAEYAFKVGGHDAAVRVNVDNLLNDQKRYGLIYAPGITYKVSTRITF